MSPRLYDNSYAYDSGYSGAYDNGYNGGYDNGYGVRNGFVCQPGTWFPWRRRSSASLSVIIPYGEQGGRIGRLFAATLHRRRGHSGDGLKHQT